MSSRGLIRHPESTLGSESESTVNESVEGVEWLARALLLVRDHPEWSDAAIARNVGKHASTLCRSKEYQAAAGMARGAKSSRHRGHATTDPHSGLRDVEAYSDDLGCDWED